MTDFTKQLQIVKNIFRIDIILILDKDGNYISAEKSRLNIFDNIFLWLQRKLTEKKNIRELFEIPADLNLKDSLPKLDIDNTKDPYSCRSGIVFFDTEQEEFYSESPLLHIYLFDIGNDHILGAVRISNSFAHILPEIHRTPIFYQDINGNIAGYNKRFLDLLPSKPELLLKQPATELLSSSPDEFHGREFKNIISGNSFNPQLVYESVEKEQLWISENLPSFKIFPVEIDWENEDFRIDIELVSGGDTIPLFIAGDIFSESGMQMITDMDGYQLSNSINKNFYCLKKYSHFIHAKHFNSDLSRGGTLRIDKIGRSFAVFFNGIDLLTFVDNETGRKGNTSLGIGIRSFDRCALGAVKIYTCKHASEPTAWNRFTSIIGRPDSYYLLDHIYSFFYGKEESYCSVYKLQDFTDLRERLSRAEQEHREMEKKAREANILLSDYRNNEHSFVGGTGTVRKILEQVDKVAKSNATILIMGPTGSGKEVLARLIHDKSTYSKGAFVKVDCSTLPKTLMESLLFGHQKGAFTGASEKHRGLFKEAENGTLFLDEISNLDMNVQAKLLQFLQDFTITPIGDNSTIKLNLRIIVASNVSLREKIRAGEFREDLYYRMAVIEMHLPGLTSRLEDMPALVNHFLGMFNIKYQRNVKSIHPAAYKKLFSHSWPGNVRELKNVLERAFLFCDGNTIKEEAVQFQEYSDALKVQSKSVIGRRTYNIISQSTEEVKDLIAKHNGMVRRVAEELSVTRQALYSFFKRNNIDVNGLRKVSRAKRI